jgi:hypothetical protein
MTIRRMTHAECRTPKRALYIIVIGLAAALLLPAVPADAQGAWPGRVVVSVNGGMQSSARTFSDRITRPLYLEDATFDIDYATESELFFDGGAVVRLWGNLGAGVAVSRYTDDTAATVEGSLPHPFHFNQPRSIEGETPELRRRETGTHLQIAWMAAPTDQVRFIISGGPSWIQAEQGLVTEVRYTEAYPFDEATFTSVDRVIEKETGTGFNVGVDVIWAFSKNIGVGGLLRYTRATADVSPSEGRSIELELGGLQAGGGIRILF